MKIPILDLSDEIEKLMPQLNEAIEGVLRSGQFIMGPSVKQFEQEIAQYLNVKHAIGLNSGTDALVIGLRALGIQPGDEVITTAFTFFATAEAISTLGARPVFVDIEPDTYNICPREIEKNITAKTRAIIPVHLFGNAAQMDKILALAERYGLKVLEDVAQAMGGDFQGRKLGTLGDLGAFSFFPSKNLGAYGDGGLIATNDDKLAEQSRMLRTHGSRRKYYNETIGYNSRLDEIQAAVLRVKLPLLDSMNEGRRRVASRYNELFANNPSLKTPVETHEARHVFHQYTVQIRGGVSRDEIHDKLAEKGIQTMIYYPVPLHQLPVYAGLKLSLPVTEKVCSEVLSLPIWPTLSPQVQLEIASVLLSLMEKAP